MHLSGFTDKKESLDKRDLEQHESKGVTCYMHQNDII